MTVDHHEVAVSFLTSQKVPEAHPIRSASPESGATPLLPQASSCDTGSAGEAGACSLVPAREHFFPRHCIDEEVDDG